MLITRYNADSGRWEVHDTDDNTVVCDTGAEETAKQIIKDYKRGAIE